MPHTLIKGNHCTLLMRKWSFQHISVHCINLELTVYFHLAVSGWLILCFHISINIVMVLQRQLSSEQIAYIGVFRSLCILCFICIILSANKCMPSHLSERVVHHT